MHIVNSKEKIENLISKNDMALVYFGSEACGVCISIKPKMEEILKKYPKIKSAEVDVKESVIISAEYNIFTIPAVLLFVEGKETIREARYMSIQDIDEKISRYYNLMF